MRGDAWSQSPVPLDWGATRRTLMGEQRTAVPEERGPRLFARGAFRHRTGLVLTRFWADEAVLAAHDCLATRS